VFDFRVLSSAVKNCGLDQEFVKVVKAFVDSLTVFRARHPKLPSYKEERLSEHFGLPLYNAHNAVDDVKALDNIFFAAICNNAETMKYSYRSDCHFIQELFTVAKDRLEIFAHLTVSYPKE
jgi:DNA polymerase III epsilon subunit-like protein